MNPWLKRLYDLTPAPVQSALVSAFSAHLEKQRYGGRFQEFRSLLEESQWWDAETMRAWQDERLRSIVRHAYEHVPYYRALFDHHGIRVDKFRGCEDLTRIPVLTRETVKSRIEDLKSRRPGDLAPGHGHTSGTTGSPLSVFYSSDVIAMNYAVMDRQYRWADARLAREGDRVAVVRGNVIVPLSQKKPPFWRHNRSLNQLLMSSFHLTPDNLTHYYEALDAFQPQMVDGYPSSLYVLAKVLLNRKHRVRRCRRSRERENQPGRGPCGSQRRTGQASRRRWQGPPTDSTQRRAGSRRDHLQCGREGIIERAPE